MTKSSPQCIYFVLSSHLLKLCPFLFFGGSFVVVSSATFRGQDVALVKLIIRAHNMEQVFSRSILFLLITVSLLYPTHCLSLPIMTTDQQPPQKKQKVESDQAEGGTDIHVETSENLAPWASRVSVLHFLERSVGLPLVRRCTTVPIPD